MRKQSQHRQPSPVKTSSSLPETNQAPSGKARDYEQGLSRLLYNGQMLCGQREGVAARLCQEVEEITQGQAQLCLFCQQTAKSLPQPSSPPGMISFPVQFRDTNYGVLYVQHDPAHPTEPIIPPAAVYLLTQICSHMLHELEISAFLHLQSQHLEAQAAESLTKREREVLNLFCCGYDRKTIAETLHIASATEDTHFQRLYEKLYVHHECDLLLAAFRARLFSPLEEASGIRSHAKT